MKDQITIVGGGIAGLTAALSLVDAGKQIRLVCDRSMGLSDSAHLDGPWNGYVPRGSRSDEARYQEEIFLKGGHLNGVAQVQEQVRQASTGVELLERLGVLFERSGEGFLKMTPVGARQQLQAKTALGQQIHARLLELLKSPQYAEQVEWLENWQFLSLALQEGQCCGVVLQNVISMEIEAFAGSKVLMATGGAQSLFVDRTTPGESSSISAMASLYGQGAILANLEFQNFSPFGLRLSDGCVALPRQDLNEKAKLWIDEENQRSLFLEADQNIKNLSKSQLIRKMAQQSEGKDFFIQLENELSPALCQLIQEQQQWDTNKPLPLEPVVDRVLGGVWVDRDYQTSLSGVYAAGDIECQHGGAAADDGDHLPALWAAGWGAAKSIMKSHSQKWTERYEEALEQAVLKEQTRHNDLLDLSGPENIFDLKSQLLQSIQKVMGIRRENKRLQDAEDFILQLKERFQRVSVRDKSRYFNREVLQARELQASLEVAHVMILSALYRNESRGMHFKADYPEQDDDNYQKLTKAQNHQGRPEIFYEPVLVDQGWKTANLRAS